ncbi:unnamed protein product [Rotaria sp. Silwood2]|nr:unnamed protein product [Rotaria sp. Silwood2]CAF4354881.1 unnamed protein product [Rotaria sp. Silwood2]
MASGTPKLHIIKYDFAENALEKRAPFREAREAHVKNVAASGNVVLGGPYGNPPTSGIMIVRNLTIPQIEQFVKDDPYVINGIVTKTTIEPFYATVGDNALKNDLAQV